MNPLLLHYHPDMDYACSFVPRTFNEDLLYTDFSMFQDPFVTSSYSNFAPEYLSEQSDSMWLCSEVSRSPLSLCAAVNSTGATFSEPPTAWPSFHHDENGLTNTNGAPLYTPASALHLLDDGSDDLSTSPGASSVASDKPYAVLIYDALMQAPGHRMMLREIYDWFQQNTRKPQESGSNGWQNSIRHNLSMNRAFENDKTDSGRQRAPSKKANSVWVLTMDAVKNGVQSTTRYRKNSGGKKVTMKKSTPQRQLSGAKGGRAARRAAIMRRQDRHQSNSPTLSDTRAPRIAPLSPDISAALPTRFDRLSVLGSTLQMSPETPAQEFDLDAYVRKHYYAGIAETG